MSELSLVQTALLLGAYVALAGAYGLVCAIERLKITSILWWAPSVAYTLHASTAGAVVAWTPLQAGWKGLIVASSIAVFAIPRITWRFLQLTHETEVES
jgi:hypothetical protein